MEKMVYFILIFCGIFSQGICNVYQENNKNSSDLLIRQKRVVGGSSRALDSNLYLVSVLLNGNYHCPATLLTTDTAISSATCFKNHNSRSLSIATRKTAHGLQIHVIVSLIYLDPNFNPAHPTFRNLVLVKFAQPIAFHTSVNRPISIYRGNLATENMISRVFNWQKPVEERGILLPSPNCRAIGVVLISIAYCQTHYPNIIGPGNLCTFASQPGEYCETHTDSGAPLIINSQLLGIFVYRRSSHGTDPDVYMNLLDPDIRRWIHEHVPSLRL